MNKARRWISAAFLISFFTANTFAVEVNVNIKGCITDQKSKEPLIGATVQIVGSSIGAVTDIDGNFQLSGVENGIYDMALDSLIRAVGRCDKYSEEAAAYGCSTELAKIRDQAVAGLSGFGLTQERAQELYAESERDTYSQELYSILAAAGLG